MIIDQIDLEPPEKCLPAKSPSTNHQINHQVRTADNLISNYLISDNLSNTENLQHDVQASQVEIQPETCLNRSLTCLLQNWGKAIFLGIVLIIGIIIILYYALYQKSLEIKQEQDEKQTKKGTTYDLIILQDPPAKCLDGSQGAYYISRNGDPTKFLVLFQGGSWCGGQDSASTLENCYSQTKTHFGSSFRYKRKLHLKHGISSSKEQNYFKDWTKVILKYCDGSGHQGSRKHPVQYQGNPLYFRGHNITVAQFDSLQRKNSLFSAATEIVVSGSSAGGPAAAMWTNYVFQNAKSAKVRSLLDGAVFLDALNVKTNKYSYSNHLKNLMKFSNEEIDPPVPECVQQFNNSIESCMLIKNIYMHLKVPLFVSQSLYDAWSIKNILGIKCVHQKANMAHCNSEQLSIIHSYRQNLSNIITQIGRSSPKNGVWAPACLWHNFMKKTYDSPLYTVPEYSQFSFPYSVKKWMQGDTPNVHVDQVNWPHNRPCSNYHIQDD